MRFVQKKIHAWGDVNKVIFDFSKESLHLLHKRFSHGDNCKLLGVVFNSGLRMHDAARTIGTEAG